MKKSYKQFLATTLSLLLCMGHFVPGVAEEVEPEPTEEVVEKVGEATEEAEKSEAVAQEVVVEEETTEAVATEEEATEEVVEEVPTTEQAKEPTVSEVAFDASKIIDGIEIHVTADAGVFPNGATLSVEKVTPEVEEEVSSAIDEKRNEKTNVALSYTFDIKVLDADGKEVQPTDNQKVRVFFTLAEVKNENLETQVYHVTEDTLDVEELVVATEGETAVVETTGFSYYTVEFTYQNLEYVLEGDSSVALSEVLNKLGLNGTVSDVQVSNDTLFSVTNENGTWMVNALQAFTSTEWMKVTIDGVEYEIVVTDTIPGATVTSMVDMANGETKSENFTIGNNGVVRGAVSGTATISNATVTNNAVNGSKGGYSSTNGSAFIARGANSFKFENATIKSGANTLVLNIWANSSINASNLTLNGSNNADNGTPFLMVGGYPNGGAGT